MYVDLLIVEKYIYKKMLVRTINNINLNHLSDSVLIAWTLGRGGVKRKWFQRKKNWTTIKSINIMKWKSNYISQCRISIHSLSFAHCDCFFFCFFVALKMFEEKQEEKEEKRKNTAWKQLSLSLQPHIEIKAPRVSDTMFEKIDSRCYGIHFFVCHNH